MAAEKIVDVCFTSRANSSCACALDKRSIIAFERRWFALRCFSFIKFRILCCFLRRRPWIDYFFRQCMFFGLTFITSPIRPFSSEESDYFSTKVYDLGLKFGGKSNCSSYTQTSQTRPIIHAFR